MARYTDIKALYNAQIQRFGAGLQAMKSAHQQIAEAGLEDARQLTSGTLTPAQTKGAYARDGGFNGSQRTLSASAIAARGLSGSFGPKAQKVGGALAPLPVNIQSARLHNSFYLARTAAGKAVQSFSLKERDPGGALWRISPGGTSKLVDSGFFPELQKRWKVRNLAFITHFRDQQRHT